jgi:hypothetical protein
MNEWWVGRRGYKVGVYEVRYIFFGHVDSVEVEGKVYVCICACSFTYLFLKLLRGLIATDVGGDILVSG